MRHCNMRVAVSRALPTAGKAPIHGTVRTAARGLLRCVNGTFTGWNYHRFTAHVPEHFDFMPPQADHTSRVEALDLLRLVAVLAVVLYHFGFWGPAAGGMPAMPWLAPVAKYGFLGVPVFFIISGFVIAYSAEGRTAAGFAIARFSRIYPTFVLCMT